MKKRISIFTPCYNEEENVEILYNEVKKVFEQLPQYDYEHVFIDNNSQDKTVEILKRIANQDKKVKIIVNARNFGHIRSPYHGLLQTTGDCVISVVADLQDPPELIPEFLKKWEEGYKIVTAVKKKSRENPLMFLLRKIYYNILAKFSEGEQIKNFTGFGLYDKSFLDIIRKIDDPYPYFRGLISEVGFQNTSVEYTQPKRLHGKTKNNFYTLYDVGMLGFVNHSKLPLRLASFIGFTVALISLFVAIAYFVYKLIYWDEFKVGTAPLVIGLFFFSSIQLFFIGIIGEYIGAIHTQVRKRPLVIEKERINFDETI
ncbi:MAG: glycosyltransferase family 2 protein [Bacteroidetes bacterium]|nr:glycosyltransferase family 2 protein [Bacteroidota bacterium]